MFSLYTTFSWNVVKTILFNIRYTRKPEQVRKLDSLGLTSSEIKSLKYEKDRVNKLLELMK